MKFTLWQRGDSIHLLNLGDQRSVLWVFGWTFSKWSKYVFPCPYHMVRFKLTEFPSFHILTAFTLTSWLGYHLLRLPNACPERLKADCHRSITQAGYDFTYLLLNSHLKVDTQAMESSANLRWPLFYNCLKNKILKRIDSNLPWKWINALCKCSSLGSSAWEALGEGVTDEW